MSVLTRIRRILSANINELIEKAENPEKIIKQLIRDMDENVREAKRETAEAIANLKKLEAKAKQNEEEVEKWQKRAEMAIKKENDELAKEALKKKNECAKIAKSFSEEAEKQRESVETLKLSLKQLEEKLDETKRRKDILIAKKRTAEATTSVHKRISGTTKDTDVFDTWQRMEEKIGDMELTAFASKESSKEFLKSTPKEEEIDIEFELKELKEKLKND